MSSLGNMPSVLWQGSLQMRMQWHGTRISPFSMTAAGAAAVAMPFKVRRVLVAGSRTLHIQLSPQQSTQHGSSRYQSRRSTAASGQHSRRTTPGCPKLQNQKQHESMHTCQNRPEMIKRN